jgi:hypothetical protein
LKPPTRYSVLEYEQCYNIISSHTFMPFRCQTMVGTSCATDVAIRLSESYAFALSTSIFFWTFLKVPSSCLIAHDGTRNCAGCVGSSTHCTHLNLAHAHPGSLYLRQNHTNQNICAEILWKSHFCNLLELVCNPKTLATSAQQKTTNPAACSALVASVLRSHISSHEFQSKKYSSLPQRLAWACSHMSDSSL